MNATAEELKTVAILALQSPVISVSLEQWHRVAERLSTRLHHPVSVVQLTSEESSCDAFPSSIKWYFDQGFRRFVVMPIGLESFDLRSLYSVVVWMRLENLSASIFVARSWTTKDWVEAFVPSIVNASANDIESLRSPSIGRKKSLLLLSQGDDSRSDVGLELACLAYYFQQAEEIQDVRYAFLENRHPRLRNILQRMDADGIQTFMLMTWRMDPTQIENAFVEMGSLHATELTIEPFGTAWTWNRFSHNQPQSIDLLEHSGWIHVALGMYFDALATRSIERYVETNHNKSDTIENCIQHGLIELDRKLDSMLPAEYQGSTDEVTSRSMGSATIPSDQFGEVAWDEIWTSFCDLAMAGGPPHRGRLLEAITAEQARAKPLEYETVVREIRRGIEMVTGLSTLHGDVLGWVGVVCNDEAMAVWLMRAIIVENVMVRREGAVLYLPAGPDFKVKKEIKNVITSMAKTVHYWRAHLASSRK